VALNDLLKHSMRRSIARSLCDICFFYSFPL